MTDGVPVVVRLLAVDDDVLERMVRAALTDASVNEVTPPLTPGEEWTPERVAWLRAFHRSRRTGLDGADGEATWAVLDAARARGLRRVRADTTAHNGAALAVLAGLGFDCTPVDGGGVIAWLTLEG
jgi:hypothetical protein